LIPCGKYLGRRDAQALGNLILWGIYDMLARYRLLFVIAVLVACAAGAGNAWIYDGGDAQLAGVLMRTGSGCVWQAAPFAVDADSYATGFGAAIGRAAGPTDAGIDVYLCTNPSGLPGSVIAQLPHPLVPLNSLYDYYDGLLDQPVLLKAGTPYYLVFAPTSPQLMSSVSFGVKQGAYCGMGSGDYGASWYAFAFPLAVRVDGYAVPEPCSAVGLLFAGLGWGIARKRKR
jgi:hypothetical protein